MCIEIGHSKSDCNVIDLYNVPDPTVYTNPLEARIEDPADISEPLVDYYRQPNGQANLGMFGLENEDDDEDLVDDSDDEEEGRKSV